MISRFKDSLVSPSRIARYRDDNLGLAFLFIFIVCALATIPTIVRTARIKKISQETKLYLRQTCVDSAELLPQGKIENGVLHITNEAQSFNALGVLYVVVPTDDIDISLYLFECKYFAKLKDEKVEFYFLNNVVGEYRYEELGLDSFDFSCFSEMDYETRTNEMIKLEKAYDYIYADTAGTWKTVSIISAFLEEVIIVIFACLIFSLSSRMIKPVSFKQSFIIALYSMTICLIVELIGEMFGLEFFMYIGLIWAYIYYVIALNNVGVISINVIK